MLRNQIVKKLLSALAVAGFGYILLNLTFLFDFLFQSLLHWIIGLFIAPDDLMRNFNWFPWALHASFVIVIGLISWLVLRSKLGVLYKAIYLTVPSAVVFVTLGMFLYRWPVAAYSLASLFAIGVLCYFYRTKQPWLYYYALILVAVTLTIFNLLGGEI